MTRAELPATGTRPARRGRVVASYVVAGLTALVLVDALVGDRGLLTLLDARASYGRVEASVVRLRAENQRMREEARRLRTDPDAIEEVARRDLGFIRPGETVFIVRDARPSATR